MTFLCIYKYIKQRGLIYLENRDSSLATGGLIWTLATADIRSPFTMGVWGELKLFIQ